jgi:predicted RNase H-like HicB family nuclease
MPDYVVTLEPAWTGYEGFVPDLGHCSAGGDTADQALENTRQEIASFAAIRREHDLPLPEARTTIVPVESHPALVELADYLILMEHLPDEFHAWIPDVIGINGTGPGYDDAIENLALAFATHRDATLARNATLPEASIEARIVSI